ncbi:Hypothetical predicted protein [Cloeon dipterum]|uniref:ALMS motif domain-containing protein n=1 Tax=Cloeon dipterum TaxID=197152 RepID=A0A8S1C5S1_9INSE|nr:Hypothetical predicted protein [Cloeon dipterum]
MSEGEYSGRSSGLKRPDLEGSRPTVSPSASVSSAASTRPLEWDSGADVGYLLQNEERQLADAIKKLGIGLGGNQGIKKNTDLTRVRLEEHDIRANNESLLSGGQKATVDSFVEERLLGAGCVPLMESTPKLAGLQASKGAAEGGSRTTLAKTASSSSLATVVSKNDQLVADKKGAELISDLTKGLHLVKSLIAETRGDKEKQSKLLAHVVKQLKTVEEGRQPHSRRQRIRKPAQEAQSSSSTHAESSSNSSDIVQQLKNSFRTRQQVGASGDSSGSLLTLESAQEEDACQRLLSSISSPEENKLLEWANSQERLALFPPDPKLNEAIELADGPFATFLQEFINYECRRQACWRSDLLNLISRRAALLRQKNVETSRKEKSLSVSSASSAKARTLPPSHLFPLNLNPVAQNSLDKKEQQPSGKIFQHIIDLKKAAPDPKNLNGKSNEATADLDEILSTPGKLTSRKPNAKKPARAVMKKDSPLRDVDLPLQEHLKKRRPNFLKQAEQRRKCLALLGERRLQRCGQRRQGLKEQVQRYSGTLPDHIDLEPLPPPPLAVKRLFTQKQLRQHTENLCRNLEETRKKEEEQKREEEHKMNRIMAQIFNRKLQNRVLHRKVDLSNSVSVITAGD